MKTTDISIVCANYNNGKYLKVFLDSIYNSTVGVKEVIIVNDGCTDNSNEILQLYSDHPNLIVIDLLKNVGFANALNVGIERVGAKYMLRCDPDDYIDSTRIEKQYELLESGAADCCGSNAYYFRDTEDNIVCETNFPQDSDKIIKLYCSGEHGCLHGTITGKADLFKKYLYRQEMVPAEDYDIFSRMIKDGVSFVNLSDCLTYVRVHSSSASNSIKYSTISKTFDLRKKIFSKSTFRLTIFLYYFHILFYRKYLFSNSKIKKYLYMLLASLTNLKKVIRRLRKYVVG